KCHGHLKTFLEEYIDQLFSYSEKLLPEKTLEKTEKWTEVKAIIRHFFAFEGDEDENETELNLITLKEVMSVKRYPIRQEMYRNCSNFRLCAITSNDKMFYYAQDQNDKEFYVPYEDQQCQKKLECKNSSVQFGVPKQYESCPFIVIVKDDIQCQQVFKMDCNNGSAKIVWERKKNV
uniref:Vitellogenin n=1 Tax=Panagrolaimus sp. PS1159 TaxID=55785 RepID=A0AC35G9Z4_9BILA